DDRSRIGRYRVRRRVRGRRVVETAARRRRGRRARPAAHPGRGPPEPRRDEAAPAPHAGVIRPLRSLRTAGRIAWRAFLRFQDHNGPDRAAAVAYYTLLSLMPLLIFLISIGVAVLGSFDVAYQGTLYLIRGVVIHMDKKSMDELRAFVEHALRFRLPGLFLLAWTSRRIFASLFSALETIFGVPGRNWAKHNLVALGGVLVTGLAVLIMMALSLFMATSEGLLMRFRETGTFQSLGGI